MTKLERSNRLRFADIKNSYPLFAHDVTLFVVLRKYLRWFSLVPTRFFFVFSFRRQPSEQPIPLCLVTRTRKLSEHCVKWIRSPLRVWRCVYIRGKWDKVHRTNVLPSVFHIPSHHPCAIAMWERNVVDDTSANAGWRANANCELNIPKRNDHIFVRAPYYVSGLFILFLFVGLNVSKLKQFLTWWPCVCREIWLHNTSEPPR